MTAKRAKMGADAGSKLFRGTAAEALGEVTGGAHDASRGQERGEAPAGALPIPPDPLRVQPGELVVTTVRFSRAQLEWLADEARRWNRARKSGREDTSEVVRFLVDRAMRGE